MGLFSEGGIRYYSGLLDEYEKKVISKMTKEEAREVDIDTFKATMAEQRKFLNTLEEVPDDLKDIKKTLNKMEEDGELDYGDYDI